MKHPNPGFRWRCCSGKPLRTPFCADCGGKAPDSMSSAEMLADDLDAEAASWYRKADTDESKAESIKVEHDLSSLVYPQSGDFETWGDRYDRRISAATAARKRGDKVAMHARIIRELLAEIAALSNST